MGHWGVLMGVVRVGLPWGHERGYTESVGYVSERLTCARCGGRLPVQRHQGNPRKSPHAPPAPVRPTLTSSNERQNKVKITTPRCDDRLKPLPPRGSGFGCR